MHHIYKQVAALLSVPTLLALSGCTAMATADAIARARAHCESEGKQFVQKQVETHDTGIVSDVVVSGECVGPGDPGYVPPADTKAPPR